MRMKMTKDVRSTAERLTLAFVQRKGRLPETVEEPAEEVSATEFKARCLRIIQDMGRSGRPVTITRRGRPVALLSPLPRRDAAPFVGMLAGTVLRFDDPFAPAAPDDWSALR